MSDYSRMRTYVALFGPLEMSPSHAVLLVVAAILAGALNSVAGGGSFFSFPALVLAGVLPVQANATSTVALWPGSVASVGAYWKRLPRGGGLMMPLLSSSLLGGVVGALLLLRTSQARFMQLVPYLFLAATLLFAFGKRISGGLGEPEGSSRTPSAATIAGVTLIQFIISIYGGFFGGGIGILMLALLNMVPLEDIHAMNGVKAALATAINGAAVVTFVVAHAVAWPEGILMLAGATLGGYGGAHWAQKLDPRLVRAVVIVAGFSMAAYFLWRR